MLYEAIFKTLQANQVKYLVIGGIAVNLHGVERPTGDLDLLLSLKKTDLDKFIQTIKRIGWQPRIPVPLEDFADPKKRKMWIMEKGMKVFSIFNPKHPLEHIDIMTENYIDFEKAYKNREIVSAKGMKILVISIPDLIRLKKIAGRERDNWDIKGLKEIERYKRAAQK